MDFVQYLRITSRTSGEHGGRKESRRAGVYSRSDPSNVLKQLVRQIVCCSTSVKQPRPFLSGEVRQNTTIQINSFFLHPITL